MVEDVPVAGDPRVLAGIGPGALFLAGLAAGLGIGTKITLLAALGVLTIGIAVLGGREGWWRALSYWLGGMLITAGFWYGRNLITALNPFPQIDKVGPINLPGPDQGGFYPREPHELSEYYNDPQHLERLVLPGAQGAPRAVVAGDPGDRGLRPRLRPGQGRQPADAAARDHRDRRRSRLRVHAPDRLRRARPADRVRRQPPLRRPGAADRLRPPAAGAGDAPPPLALDPDRRSRACSSSRGPSWSTPAIRSA